MADTDPKIVDGDDRIYYQIEVEQVAPIFQTVEENRQHPPTEHGNRFPIAKRPTKKRELFPKRVV